MSLNDSLNNIENVPQENNFSFSCSTTYGLGGNAKYAFFPENISQAQEVYNYIKQEKIGHVILGKGSNILASDKFFDGAVIGTKNLKGVYLTEKNSVFCFAGTSVSALLKFCLQNGLGGIEYLAGIPASLGGLVYMNGGACGKYICDNIVSVKHFDGKMRDLSNKNCNFGHKYSIMRDINGIILGAELNLVPQTREKTSEIISQVLKKRKGLPKGKSCGCVFKNPQNFSAGKIIDEVGLKGLSCGGATVSKIHANFIINNGATSAEVYSLIREVKRRVFERTGITLEEEVVYIGDF